LKLTHKESLRVPTLTICDKAEGSFPGILDKPTWASGKRVSNMGQDCGLIQGEILIMGNGKMEKFKELEYSLLNARAIVKRIFNIKARF
jgi:hypothetical protein